MNYTFPKNTYLHANLSIMLAAFAVSNVATTIEEIVPVPEAFHKMEQQATFISPFDLLASSYQSEGLINEKDVIHSFLNNLVTQSKDLDGDIVSLVNENFWNLI